MANLVQRTLTGVRVYADPPPPAASKPETTTEWGTARAIDCGIPIVTSEHRCSKCGSRYDTKLSNCKMDPNMYCKFHLRVVNVYHLCRGVCEAVVNNQ